MATGGGYQQLSGIRDPGVSAAVKNILDRLGALEQRVALLQAQVNTLPTTTITQAQMQQYTQQQVANLRAEILALLP